MQELVARDRVAPDAGAAAKPLTRGVHHLALNTDDMKATIDFWTEVLGMPLILALKVPKGASGPLNRGNPPYEDMRHYFFDMGNDSTVAFFEIPKGAKAQADRDEIGGMQHCSFSATPAAFEELQKRLKARKIEFLGPMPVLPGVQSIYFFDNNGIRLEATCHGADGANQQIIKGVTQTKAVARAELATITKDEAWLAKVTAAMPD
jgi:catechol 2,3-dioxygenase-like lactoylglutathione lyase family enzyme